MPKAQTVVLAGASASLGAGCVLEGQPVVTDQVGVLTSHRTPHPPAKPLTALFGWFQLFVPLPFPSGKHGGAAGHSLCCPSGSLAGVPKCFHASRKGGMRAGVAWMGASPSQPLPCAAQYPLCPEETGEFNPKIDISTKFLYFFKFLKSI